MATQFCEYTKTADLYTYYKSEVYVIWSIFQDKVNREKPQQAVKDYLLSGMPRV